MSTFINQDITDNPNYDWADITVELKQCVTDLELGEIIHDDSFGLFDAMSAIEMMDPKMDAGMLCNRGTSQVKSVTNMISDGTLILDNLKPDHLIAVIDVTYSCLASWLEGHTLAQTVFINVYLHHPYLIDDRVLKVFCFSIYKIIDFIKDFINRAMVYEEEDFQPTQYGFQLVPDVSDERMMSMLKDVENETQARYRSNPTEENQAICSRVKFTRVLFNTLLLLKRENVGPVVGDCQKLISLASDTLKIMQSTIHCGMKGDEDELIPGFEPYINQRLLPPTFPRYTKMKPRDETMQYFMHLFDRLRVVLKLQMNSYLQQALDFFTEFSKTNPCVLSRSILQLIYQVHNITTSSVEFRENLRESVKSFISPPVLMSKTLCSEPQTKMYLNSFFVQCIRPFANLLQLCGHNRARQRDRLAGMIEDMVPLQEKADQVDAYLQSLALTQPQARPNFACFGTWVLFHILKLMIMYLLSGFELELYSLHEFYYIYWYLYEFLYAWMVSDLTRVDNFLLECELVAENANKGKNSKKMKKTRKRFRSTTQDIIYYQALQQLCGGYYKAFLGFRLDGKITMPNPEFDNEQVRFEHRFAPFSTLLTPPAVKYAEFREMSSLERYQRESVESAYLYALGCKHFHQARQLLESMHPVERTEESDLLKIAKTNFVVLKLYAGGHKPSKSDAPQLDYSLSKYFPIMKLSP